MKAWLAKACMVKADVEESAKHLQSAQAALTTAEDDLADKKEALTKAKARAAATLHALNLAKARLAALEATQPTEPTTPTEPTKPTEPTTEPPVEPSTEPTGTEENTEEPADTEEDTDGGDVVTVVNTDEEPGAKSAAKAPAATATRLPQTGEKDTKPGILSLLVGVSLFGFSFKKRKQEK